MAMSLRVVVPPHPLIAHWLWLLRDPATPTPLVGTAMAELGRWLTYEALRDWLPQRSLQLDTPHGPCEGQVVDPSIPLLAIPLLPSGLGLWDGARGVLPAAALAPVSATAMELDGRWMPERIGERVGVLVFAGQIASGRSLLHALERLRSLGVEGRRLRVITTVAAAPGLQLLGEAMPDLTLYCACIDAQLDGRGWPQPGIGDLEQRFSGIDRNTCLG
ncbi:MAG: uracil phosphoribosyltransferase [Synechococcaceae cyanobacterium]|nr:uracil phosphoribosyltransferase [Synechococcaceae cyanobacterium]